MICATSHEGLQVLVDGKPSRQTIEDEGDHVLAAGVILSGSTALDLLAPGMVNAPAGLAAFNAGFEHRTGYEWLSRDAAEVYAYVADPWCGWDMPDDVIPALLARIRSDLPILIASGDADPLAAGGGIDSATGAAVSGCRCGRCDGQAVPGGAA